MPDTPSQTELLELTAEVVSAHASNNTVAASDLPQVIKDVYATFSTLGVAAPPIELPTPVVPIKKSVTPDFIICLEDGKKVPNLKRHLRTSHNMDFDECRVRWGLPDDYPSLPEAITNKKVTTKKIMS